MGPRCLLTSKSRSFWAVQVPLWQVLASLHTCLSSQAVLLATLVLVHPLAAAQPSVVQVLPSSQLTAVPLHRPLLSHASLVVHVLLSVHC